jgi:hypothetical protein
MVSFKPLLLLATIALAAVTVIPRSAELKLILSDLKSLDESVIVLHSAIDNYTGGLITAAPILLAITGVHLANRKTYNDAQVIGNATVAESQAILDYVSDPIAVDIPKTAEATRSKKALFVADGIEGTVLSSLQLLKDDHDTLSAALEKKVAPSLLAEAAVPVKVIDDALQSAIDDFSS